MGHPVVIFWKRNHFVMSCMKMLGDTWCRITGDFSTYWKYLILHINFWNDLFMGWESLAGNQHTGISLLDHN